MTFDDLLTTPVMVILRGLPPDETVRLCRVAWDLGIPSVEVPIGDLATQTAALAAAVEAGREASRPVGAGTVVSTAHVDAARAAGAAYTVAPGFDAEVLAASTAQGLPHLPGVATATELHGALRAGCTWVKCFPARALGPTWFRDVRGPFPHVKMVATGGITPATAREYLDAGARVVGIGSALADPAQLPLLAALLG